MSEQAVSTSFPITESMQPDVSPKTEDAIVSGASVSRSQFSSPPHGVVVVSQDPVARLTFWLPGQIQDTEHSHNIESQSEDYLIHELKPDYLFELPTADEELLYPRTNEINGLRELKSDPSLWAMSLVDGWPLPPQPDSPVIVEELQRKNRLGRSGRFDTVIQQNDNTPVSAEMDVKDIENDFNQIREELGQMQADAPVANPEATNDAQPMVRSKIQLSKGADGSQTLSYEEEIKSNERKGVIRTCGMHSLNQGSGQKGLYSTFLDLFR